MGGPHRQHGLLQRVGGEANDASKLSDVLTLTGTNTDKFVLQLTYTGAPAQGTPFIAYYSSTYGGYVNAIAGNSSGNMTPFGGTAYGEITGAYDPASDFVLGDYGFDSSTNTAWAVLDHNSDYEVIPESQHLGDARRRLWHAARLAARPPPEVGARELRRQSQPLLQKAPQFERLRRFCFLPPTLSGGPAIPPLSRARMRRRR